VTPRAVIYGCSGVTLRPEERAFFRESDPWGFILFQRNCADPAQVCALTAELRETVGRHAPVLIDQEGGRVQRLKPPHWRARPPARSFAQMWREDPERALRLTKTNARAMAYDLASLGIDVDCAPVLDVPVAGAHDVIGDRAFGHSVEQIAALAEAQMQGLLDGGVLPVIKHIPGHGRAMADSHHELPVVTASAGTLEATDFATFRRLAHAPLAMTAHVVFTAYDAARPATASPRVIAEVIRRSIGYDGALMSDDLSMKALAGTMSGRTQSAFSAGCDLALHCNGEMAEMKSVASATPHLAGDALRRCDAALSWRKAPKPVEIAAIEAELSSIFGAAA
jgi:beta-N-acetylhexosaminidase